MRKWRLKAKYRYSDLGHGVVRRGTRVVSKGQLRRERSITLSVPGDRAGRTDVAEVSFTFSGDAVAEGDHWEMWSDYLEEVFDKKASSVVDVKHDAEADEVLARVASALAGSPFVIPTRDEIREAAVLLATETDQAAQSVADAVSADEPPGSSTDPSGIAEEQNPSSETVHVHAERPVPFPKRRVRRIRATSSTG